MKEKVIAVLKPRYYFSDDFRQFQDYFFSQPHTEKTFKKGDLIWPPGKPYEKLHYILSGVEMHYAVHESGHRKIISFHGPCTVFPGYRQNDYKIELSLITEAISDMHMLEFTLPQFGEMLHKNTELCEQVINWYSMYINLFLFETIHQEFNTSLVKLSNLLYILTANQPADSGPVIEMTQEELADILGLSRVQITRELSELRRNGIVSTTRGRLTVTDLAALTRLCTSETV